MCKLFLIVIGAWLDPLIFVGTFSYVCTNRAGMLSACVHELQEPVLDF